MPEEPAEVRVLEIADPVGDAEVAKIDNGHDAEPLELAKGLVDKAPIIFAIAEPSRVDRRAIAQEADAQLLYEREVGTPQLVVAAFRHLVDPRPTTMDRRVAVLGACGEHEEWIYQVNPPAGLVFVADDLRRET